MSHDDSATASPVEGFLSRWLVPLCALAGLAVGLAIFSIREPVYESRTIISVNNPIGTMGDEAALVLSDRVLGIVTSTLGFEPDLEVEANEVANLLTVTVRASDPDDAALAATQLAEVYTQSQTTVAVRVADPAESDPDPVSPNRILHILVGSVVGAMLGGLLAAARGVELRLPTVAARATTAQQSAVPDPIRPAVESADLGRKLVDAAGRRRATANDGVDDGDPHHRSSEVRVIDLRERANASATKRLSPAPTPAEPTASLAATRTAGDSPGRAHTSASAMLERTRAEPSPAVEPSPGGPVSSEPASAESLADTRRPPATSAPANPAPEPPAGETAVPETPVPETPAPETQAETMARFRSTNSPFSRASHSMVSEPATNESRWSTPDLPQQVAEPAFHRDETLPIDLDPGVPPTFADELPPIRPIKASSFTDALPSPSRRAAPRDDEPTPAASSTSHEALVADSPEPAAPPRFVSDLAARRSGEGAASALDDRGDGLDAGADPRSDERDALPDTIVQADPPVARGTRPPERTATINAAVESALEIAEAKFDSRLADAAMAHEEQLSAVEAHYERHVAELKRELAEARKQARTASAHIKRMTGDDQHRIGDLEAQAAALEAEITSLRDQLESERIAHLRELTAERDAADQALDNARRDFREQLEANDQANRASMATNRVELDEVLAEVRAEHQAALDRQHREYEAAMNAERDRRRADLAKLTRRHRDEVAALQTRAGENEAQLARKTKQTLAELRASEKRLTGEVDDLREANRQFRGELGVLRKNLRDAEQKHTDTEQALRDDLALTRQSLQSERERNAALREDVVRRTAEAHQAVDRAIDDRTAQLAELEAVVNRQREHAELRVREANQAAEDRARESAKRESELHARIVRLERELAQHRHGGDSKTG